MEVAAREPIVLSRHGGARQDLRLVRRRSRRLRNLHLDLVNAQGQDRRGSVRDGRTSRKSSVLTIPSAMRMGRDIGLDPGSGATCCSISRSTARRKRSKRNRPVTRTSSSRTTSSVCSGIVLGVLRRCAVMEAALLLTTLGGGAAATVVQGSLDLVPTTTASHRPHIIVRPQPKRRIGRDGLDSLSQVRTLEQAEGDHDDVDTEGDHAAGHAHDDDDVMFVADETSSPRQKSRGAHRSKPSSSAEWSWEVKKDELGAASSSSKKTARNAVRHISSKTRRRSNVRHAKTKGPAVAEAAAVQMQPRGRSFSSDQRPHKGNLADGIAPHLDSSPTGDRDRRVGAVGPILSELDGSSIGSEKTSLDDVESSRTSPEQPEMMYEQEKNNQHKKSSSSPFLVSSLLHPLGLETVFSSLSYGLRDMLQSDDGKQEDIKQNEQAQVEAAGAALSSTTHTGRTGASSRPERNAAASSVLLERSETQDEYDDEEILDELESRVQRDEEELAQFRKKHHLVQNDRMKTQKHTAGSTTSIIFSKPSSSSSTPLSRGVVADNGVPASESFRASNRGARRTNSNLLPEEVEAGVAVGLFSKEDHEHQDSATLSRRMKKGHDRRRNRTKSSKNKSGAEEHHQDVVDDHVIIQKASAAPVPVELSNNQNHNHDPNQVKVIFEKSGASQEHYVELGHQNSKRSTTMRTYVTSEAPLEAPPDVPYHLPSQQNLMRVVSDAPKAFMDFVSNGFASIHAFFSDDVDASSEEDVDVEQSSTPEDDTKQPTTTSDEDDATVVRKVIRKASGVISKKTSTASRSKSRRAKSNGDRVLFDVADGNDLVRDKSQSSSSNSDRVVLGVGEQEEGQKRQKKAASHRIVFDFDAGKKEHLQTRSAVTPNHHQNKQHHEHLHSVHADDGNLAAGHKKNTREKQPQLEDQGKSEIQLLRDDNLVTVAEQMQSQKDHGNEEEKATLTPTTTLSDVRQMLDSKPSYALDGALSAIDTGLAPHEKRGPLGQLSSVIPKIDLFEKSRSDSSTTENEDHNFSPAEEDVNTQNKLMSAAVASTAALLHTHHHRADSAGNAKHAGAGHGLQINLQEVHHSDTSEDNKSKPTRGRQHQKINLHENEYEAAAHLRGETREQVKGASATTSTSDEEATTDSEGVYLAGSGVDENEPYFHNQDDSSVLDLFNNEEHSTSKTLAEQAAISLAKSDDFINQVAAKLQFVHDLKDDIATDKEFFLFVVEQLKTSHLFHELVQWKARNHIADKIRSIWKPFLNRLAFRVAVGIHDSDSWAETMTAGFLGLPTTGDEVATIAPESFFQTHLENSVSEYHRAKALGRKMNVDKQRGREDAHRSRSSDTNVMSTSSTQSASESDENIWPFSNLPILPNAFGGSTGAIESSSSANKNKADQEKFDLAISGGQAQHQPTSFYPSGSRSPVVAAVPKAATTSSNNYPEQATLHEAQLRQLNAAAAKEEQMAMNAAATEANEILRGSTIDKAIQNSMSTAVDESATGAGKADTQELTKTERVRERLVAQMRKSKAKAKQNGMQRLRLETMQNAAAAAEPNKFVRTVARLIEKIGESDSWDAKKFPARVASRIEHVSGFATNLMSVASKRKAFVEKISHQLEITPEFIEKAMLDPVYLNVIADTLKQEVKWRVGKSRELVSMVTTLGGLIEGRHMLTLHTRNGTIDDRILVARSQVGPLEDFVQQKATWLRTLDGTGVLDHATYEDGAFQGVHVHPSRQPPPYLRSHSEGTYHPGMEDQELPDVVDLETWKRVQNSAPGNTRASLRVVRGPNWRWEQPLDELTTADKEQIRHHPNEIVGGSHGTTVGGSGTIGGGKSGSSQHIVHDHHHHHHHHHHHEDSDRQDEQEDHADEGHQEERSDDEHDPLHVHEDDHDGDGHRDDDDNFFYDEQIAEEAVDPNHISSHASSSAKSGSESSSSSLVGGTGEDTAESRGAQEVTETGASAAHHHITSGTSGTSSVAPAPTSTSGPSTASETNSAHQTRTASSGTAQAQEVESKKKAGGTQEQAPRAYNGAGSTAKQQRDVAQGIVPPQKEFKPAGTRGVTAGGRWSAAPGTQKNEGSGSQSSYMVPNAKTLRELEQRHSRAQSMATSHHALDTNAWAQRTRGTRLAKGRSRERHHKAQMREFRWSRPGAIPDRLTTDQLNGKASKLPRAPRRDPTGSSLLRTTARSKSGRTQQSRRGAASRGPGRRNGSRNKFQRQRPRDRTRGGRLQRDSMHVSPVVALADKGRQPQTYKGVALMFLQERAEEELSSTAAHGASSAAEEDESARYAQSAEKKYRNKNKDHQTRENIDFLTTLANENDGSIDVSLISQTFQDSLSDLLAHSRILRLQVLMHAVHDATTTPQQRAENGELDDSMSSSTRELKMLAANETGVAAVSTEPTRTCASWSEYLHCLFAGSDSAAAVAEEEESASADAEVVETREEAMPTLAVVSRKEMTPGHADDAARVQQKPNKPLSGPQEVSLARLQQKSGSQFRDSGVPTAVSVLHALNDTFVQTVGEMIANSDVVLNKAAAKIKTLLEGDPTVVSTLVDEMVEEEAASPQFLHYVMASLIDPDFDLSKHGGYFKRDFGGVGGSRPGGASEWYPPPSRRNKEKEERMIKDDGEQLEGAEQTLRNADPDETSQDADQDDDATSTNTRSTSEDDATTSLAERKKRQSTTSSKRANRKSKRKVADAGVGELSAQEQLEQMKKEKKSGPRPVSTEREPSLVHLWTDFRDKSGHVVHEESSDTGANHHSASSSSFSSERLQKLHSFSSSPPQVSLVSLPPIHKINPDRAKHVAEIVQRRIAEQNARARKVHAEHRQDQEEQSKAAYGDRKDEEASSSSKTQQKDQAATSKHDAQHTAPASLISTSRTTVSRTPWSSSLFDPFGEHHHVLAHGAKQKLWKTGVDSARAARARAEQRLERLRTSTPPNHDQDRQPPRPELEPDARGHARMVGGPEKYHIMRGGGEDDDIDPMSLVEQETELQARRPRTSSFVNPLDEMADAIDRQDKDADDETDFMDSGSIVSDDDTVESSLSSEDNENGANGLALNTITSRASKSELGDVDDEMMKTLQKENTALRSLATGEDSSGASRSTREGEVGAGSTTAKTAARSHHIQMLNEGAQRRVGGDQEEEDTTAYSSDSSASSSTSSENEIMEDNSSGGTTTAMSVLYQGVCEGHEDDWDANSKPVWASHWDKDPKEDGGNWRTCMPDVGSTAHCLDVCYAMRDCQQVVVTKNGCCYPFKGQTCENSRFAKTVATAIVGTNPLTRAAAIQERAAKKKLEAQQGSKNTSDSDAPVSSPVASSSVINAGSASSPSMSSSASSFTKEDELVDVKPKQADDAEASTKTSGEREGATSQKSDNAAEQEDEDDVEEMEEDDEDATEVEQEEGIVGLDQGNSASAQTRGGRQDADHDAISSSRSTRRKHNMSSHAESSSSESSSESSDYRGALEIIDDPSSPSASGVTTPADDSVENYHDAQAMNRRTSRESSTDSQQQDKASSSDKHDHSRKDSSPSLSSVIYNWITGGGGAKRDGFSLAEVNRRSTSQVAALFDGAHGRRPDDIFAPPDDQTFVRIPHAPAVVDEDDHKKPSASAPSSSITSRGMLKMTLLEAGHTSIDHSHSSTKTSSEAAAADRSEVEEEEEQESEGMNVEVRNKNKQNAELEQHSSQNKAVVAQEKFEETRKALQWLKSIEKEEKHSVEAFEDSLKVPDLAGTFLDEKKLRETAESFINANKRKPSATEVEQVELQPRSSSATEQVSSSASSGIRVDEEDQEDASNADSQHAAKHAATAEMKIGRREEVSSKQMLLDGQNMNQEDDQHQEMSRLPEDEADERQTNEDESKPVTYEESPSQGFLHADRARKRSSDRVIWSQASSADGKDDADRSTSTSSHSRTDHTSAKKISAALALVEKTRHRQSSALYAQEQVDGDADSSDEDAEDTASSYSDTSDGSDVDEEDDEKLSRNRRSSTSRSTFNNMMSLAEVEDARTADQLTHMQQATAGAEPGEWEEIMRRNKDEKMLSLAEDFDNEDDDQEGA